MDNAGKLQLLIGGLLFVILATFMFVGATEQPLSYHDFADKNRHFGIPNFANVASNLAFLIPGLIGLFLVQGSFLDKKTFIDPLEVIPFYTVFLGSVFLAFGSGFYHLMPNNLTLVADRMTMTVGFMAVLSFMIAERISVRWGIKLLPSFLVAGLFSVAYWIYTELQGAGDLRLYGLVQFLPLVAIAAMVLTLPARYSGVKYIWLALGATAAAKVFEHFDVAVWQGAQHLISGHTLKHLASGLGIYFLVLYIKKREPV